MSNQSIGVYTMPETLSNVFGDNMTVKLTVVNGIEQWEIVPIKPIPVTWGISDKCESFPLSDSRVVRSKIVGTGKDIRRIYLVSDY